VLQALIPLTIIDFAIVPSIDTFAMCLAILEEPEIGVGVRVSFEATAISHIELPLSFILATVPITHYTSAMPFSILHLTHVQGICISLLKVVGKFLKRFEVELGTLKHNLIECWKISSL